MKKIVVCLKQVPDPVSVEIDPLTGQINTRRLVYITNPSDQAALELALSWRERIGNAKVYVVTIGAARTEKMLRDALACGADKAFRGWGNHLEFENSPRLTAIALEFILRSLQPDLVLCGTRSVDNSSGQVPGYLAEYLHLALATGVTFAEYNITLNQISVERKLERGRRQKLNLTLPALVAVETGIAELRYASFPALLKAQKEQIELVEIKRAEVREAGGLRLTATTNPRPRPRQIFIPDPDLPANQRIAAILSGGAGVKVKKGGVVDGSPQEQAERIETFLEERGFLD